MIFDYRVLIVLESRECITLRQIDEQRVTSLITREHIRTLLIVHPTSTSLVVRRRRVMTAGDAVKKGRFQGIVGV